MRTLPWEIGKSRAIIPGGLPTNVQPAISRELFAGGWPRERFGSLFRLPDADARAGRKNHFPPEVEGFVSKAINPVNNMGVRIETLRQCFPVVPEGWGYVGRILYHRGDWHFGQSKMLVTRLHAAHNLGDLFTAESHKRVALFVSSMLQHDEAVTRENLEPFKTGKGVKYLVCTIDPQAYSYWVFAPTENRLAQSVARFQEALDFLRSNEAALRVLITQGHSWDKLWEHREMSSFVQQAIGDLHQRMTDRVMPLRGKLGFLMQEVPGTKTCTPVECRY